MWRALHLSLQAPVAVKMIDPGIAQVPDALARFHREAQAAAALRSPNVVQILDHGVDELTRAPFIVMELMEGESLADRLDRQGRLTAADTTRIVSQMARALTRAHAAGIVHRDLKPDNVFLVRNEDEEVAKILDFGIAKSDVHKVGAATATGTVMGTAYYMSPEQISGSKEVDHRTDLWALGVIAHECLTGAKPFDSETLGGMVLKICTEPIRAPSVFGGVPAGFDRWFERAVMRDPALRFQSAREMAEELKRICDGGALVGAPIAAEDLANSKTQWIDTGRVGFSQSGELSADTQVPLSRTASHTTPSAQVKPRSAVPWIVGTVALLAVAGGAVIYAVSGPKSPAAPDSTPVAATTPLELEAPPRDETLAAAPDPHSAQAAAGSTTVAAVTSASSEPVVALLPSAPALSSEALPPKPPTHRSDARPPAAPREPSQREPAQREPDPSKKAKSPFDGLLKSRK